MLQASVDDALWLVPVYAMSVINYPKVVLHYPSTVMLYGYLVKSVPGCITNEHIHPPCLDLPR